MTCKILKYTMIFLFFMICYVVLVSCYINILEKAISLSSDVVGDGVNVTMSGWGHSNKEYLNGVSPLAIPGSTQGVGFYESSYSKGTGIPDIELMIAVANATDQLTQRYFSLTDQTYEDVWKYNNIPQTFIFHVVNLHAQSSGSVRLKSKNPFEYPVINSNFLSDPENRDINTLYKGIQICLKMGETKAMEAINATLQGGPLRACKRYQYLSKDYWYCALRQITVNLYQPLGSCPMGKDPKKGAVVVSELRVFGERAVGGFGQKGPWGRW